MQLLYNPIKNQIYIVMFTITPEDEIVGIVQNEKEQNELFIVDKKHVVGFLQAIIGQL